MRRLVVTSLLVLGLSAQTSTSAARLVRNPDVAETDDGVDAAHTADIDLQTGNLADSKTGQSNFAIAQENQGDQGETAENTIDVGAAPLETAAAQGENNSDHETAIDTEDFSQELGVPDVIEETTAADAYAGSVQSADASDHPMDMDFSSDATIELHPGVIGRCGHDPIDKGNLISDGGFECMTGGAEFNGTRWTFPEGTGPFNRFFQSGNSSLRVPYRFNKTITVMQTIELEEDTTCPLYAQAFASFDDFSVPTKEMADSDRSFRVFLLNADGRVVQQDILTFNQDVPWQWTPTVKDIKPVAPYRKITVELYYRNVVSNWTENETGYIWYDVVAVRFNPSAGSNVRQPAVVDLESTANSRNGDLADDGSKSTKSALTIVLGTVISVSIVLLAVLAAAVWRWRSRKVPAAAVGDVPSWVGPDHVPYKHQSIVDKMFDRRSLYSVGTTLSEQVRQWRTILARTETTRTYRRDGLPVANSHGSH